MMNSYILIGLITLTLVGQRALCFSAGTGGCPGDGGMASGGHAMGELEDGGFALEIGEEIVVPDIPITIETGFAYDFQIISSTDKTLGRALIRLQTDAYLSLFPGESGDVRTTEACVPLIVDSMHTDTSQKTSFVGSCELLSEGSLSVNVVVLEESSFIGSTYWHSTYFFEVVDVLPDVPIGTSRLLQFPVSSPPSMSSAPSFSAAPSSFLPPAPSPATPPTSGTVVQETFDGVLLVFRGVRKMSLGEIQDFELITKNWFETFYFVPPNDFSTLDAEDMQTTIRVTDQVVSVGQDGDLLINEVTYQQEIVYTTEMNIIPPMDYITLPFLDNSANQEYADLLKSQIAAFEDVQSPIPTPQFTSSESDDGGNVGVIVGSVVGIAVCIAILVVAILIWKKKKSTVVGRENTAQRNAGQEIRSNVQPNAATVENPPDIVAEEVPPSTVLADAVLIEEDIQVPLTGGDQGLPRFKDQARDVAKPSQDHVGNPPQDRQPHTKARAPRARHVGLDP